jgi:hypothetical protein
VFTSNNNLYYGIRNLAASFLGYQFPPSLPGCGHPTNKQKLSIGAFLSATVGCHHCLEIRAGERARIHDCDLKTAMRSHTLFLRLEKTTTMHQHLLLLLLLGGGGGRGRAGTMAQIATCENAILLARDALQSTSICPRCDAGIQCSDSCLSLTGSSYTTSCVDDCNYEYLPGYKVIRTATASAGESNAFGYPIPIVSTTLAYTLTTGGGAVGSYVSIDTSGAPDTCTFVFNDEQCLCELRTCGGVDNNNSSSSQEATAVYVDCSAFEGGSILDQCSVVPALTAESSLFDILVFTPDLSCNNTVAPPTTTGTTPNTTVATPITTPTTTVTPPTTISNTTVAPSTTTISNTTIAPPTTTTPNTTVAPPTTTTPNTTVVTPTMTTTPFSSDAASAGFFWLSLLVIGSVVLV